MNAQSLTFIAFLRANASWLSGGVLLTLCSSVGQTFFISLFAGEIREEFALSHGDFGLLYMFATLGSAMTLIWLGKLVDEVSIATAASVWIIILGCAAVLMALAQNMLVLLVCLYLLRLFGQGMLTHTTQVAMGRWFHSERGRAVAVTSAGHQIGEGLLPIATVLALMLLDWRTVWLIAAALLVLFALPLSRKLLSNTRTPSQSDKQHVELGRQWSRAQALRDAPFWAVCIGVIAPAFIGTSVFFHQAHLAHIKLWAPTVVAGSFAVLSVSAVGVGLIAGHLIDRYSARTILPYFLLPLALGCLCLSYFDSPVTMYVFMFLLGTSYGFSNTVFGSIWPETYGTRHLGAIRAVVSATMVFASALGPGVTGWFIDKGVGFEQQLLAMSVYCVLTMLVLFAVSGVLTRRHQERLSG